MCIHYGTVYRLVGLAVGLTVSNSIPISGQNLLLNFSDDDDELKKNIKK